MAKIPKTAYDLLRETSESRGVSLESSTVGNHPFVNPETGEPLIFTDPKHGDFYYVADTIFGKKVFRGSEGMRDYSIEDLKRLKCARNQESN